QCHGWPQKHREPQTLARGGLPAPAILTTPGGLPLGENREAFRSPAARRLPGEIIRRASFVDHDDLLFNAAGSQDRLQLVGDKAIAALNFRHASIPATCRLRAQK